MSDDLEPVRPVSTHALTHPDEQAEDSCALGALATSSSDLMSPTASRRKMLQRAGTLSLSLAMAPMLRVSSARAQTAAPTSDVLVFLFLRGAMDGLNTIIPRGDVDATGKPYYDTARPTVGIVHTDNYRPIGGGFFHHHPALDPLFGPGKAWDPAGGSRELAIIHAAGCDSLSRSHFDSQDLVDKGVGTKDNTLRDGWIGRLLADPNRGGGLPLRALAFSATRPLSLVHPSLQPVVLRTLDDITLQTTGDAAQVRSSLQRLFTGLEHPLPISASAAQALAAADAVGVAKAQPAGAGYPTTGIGPAFSALSRLIKAGPAVGLEAAAVNFGAFDMHKDLGGEKAPATLLDKWSTSGPLHDRLTDIALALNAFRADLRAAAGNPWQRVTVVVVTEFGRRVEDNDAGGTEHGRGGVMMVLGGNVNANNGGFGNVYGDWPGLAPSKLVGGDLKVTTDYRRVLHEVATRRLGLTSDYVSTVFPDLASASPDLKLTTPLGLFGP